MARSSYYYRHHPGNRGRKPSMYRLLSDGSFVSNAHEVIAIGNVLSEAFMISVGDINISKDLQMDGFLINKKKVYRLMKEHKLLLGT